MNTEHLTTSTLASYQVDPAGIDALVADHLEEHVLTCSRCRSVLADCTPIGDLERSWRDIVTELDLDDAGGPQHVPDVSDRHRRSPLARSVLAAACLALVAVAAVLVLVRRDPGAPATPSLPAGFVDLGPVDEMAPGELRWVEQHRLFLVRTETEFLALSQRSPHRGCRFVTLNDLAAAQPDFDATYFGPDVVFYDPCHGSTFRLDGSRVGGPSARDMYRYRVDTFTGRVIVDLRLTIPGPYVDRDPASEQAPIVGPGVVDDVSRRWLSAADGAVPEILAGNDGPLLWPLGAFHDPASGLVSLPLTVGYEFGVLEIGAFDAMQRWDYDALDVIVPGVQTSLGVMNVYRSKSDRTAVYVEVTLPDDSGVRLSLGHQSTAGETAVDVLEAIVMAHELDQ